jgi:drug/metabolite transporter (DMT)-like permease
MSVPYDETVLTANTAGPSDAANTGSPGSAGLRGRPVLRAVLGACCISSSAIMVTLAHSGDVTVAFYRCALALLALIPLAVLEQRRRGSRPLACRLQAGLAGLFLAVDLVLWNHSIADVGAGIATVLGNLQVLFVAVLAWLVLKERPSGRYLTLLPLILLGVVLVSGVIGGTATGMHPLPGMGFGIATSAAYAGFLLIMRQAARSTQNVAGQLADATVGAALGALLIGACSGGLELRIPWASLGWLLVLALLSGTAGWLLITSSLPHLPASVSSLVLLLQPAASMVLADLILGERPTAWQILGALLVCCGVLAVTWAGPVRRQRVPAGKGLAAEPQAVTANRT